MLPFIDNYYPRLSLAFPAPTAVYLYMYNHLFIDSSFYKQNYFSSFSSAGCTLLNTILKLIDVRFKNPKSRRLNLVPVSTCPTVSFSLFSCTQPLELVL